MKEVVVIFALGALPRPALVVDTATDETGWNSLCGLARRVLENLEADVFVLGSSTCLPSTRFLDECPDLFRDYRGRPRLIAPAYRQMERGSSGNILVLADGPIHDLSDWLDTPMARRTIWVAIGSEAVTAGQAMEVRTPAVENLRVQLANPVVRIELGGVKSIPIDWDNELFEGNLTGLTARVAPGAGRSGQLRLRATFLAPGPADVQVQLTRADGSHETPILTDPTGSVITPAWRSMPLIEARALGRSLGGEPFTCPQCGEEHLAGTLECPGQKQRSGSVLPPKVFPTFENAEFSQGGFTIVRVVDAEKAVYRHHPRPFLALADGTVLWRRAGSSKGAICRFDPEAGAWIVGEEMLGPHVRLEDESHALLL